MQKWLWLVLVGLVIVGGLILWWVRQAPSSEVYRAKVLEILRGREGLDPGLAFLLRGLRVDLDCRDEELCTRIENFAFVYDLAEEYEPLIGDYWGQVCHSKRIKPSAADSTDHEQLCHLLDALFKEVRGIKAKAAQALSLLHNNSAETVQRLLRSTLQRILAHRDRVLQITAGLQKISWLEPVVRTEPQPAP
jgi:hypothetical protein